MKYLIVTAFLLCTHLLTAQVLDKTKSNKPPLDLNGIWTAGDSREIRISVKDNTILIDMSAFKRPTVQGVFIDNKTISVNFGDVKTIFTGTLQSPDKILWSNGTQWTKTITITNPLPSNPSPTVTVYENENFSGKSKTLAVGSYNLFALQGIKVSSIKVPTGFYAVLYDNIDDGGGYGISIDLLEDVSDLAVFNMNDKVAFIEITNTPQRQGFIWIRGIMQNGQYMPPHWERARADGSSLNTTMAVAAPFTQSKLLTTLLFSPKRLKNKATQKIMDVRESTVGSAIVQTNSDGTVAQTVQFSDAGNGNFTLLSKFNLPISLKFNDVLSNGTASTNNSSRILVQDNKYNASNSCNLSPSANCPQHQMWKLTPVFAEPFTYIIESVAFQNMVLQTSPTDPLSIQLATVTNTDNQKWIIADPNDLIFSPMATSAEITEFDDVMTNQIGVAILSGETTKPFYYHHNQPNEVVYKYKKTIDITQIPESVVKKATDNKAGQLFLQLFTPLGGIRFLLEVVGKVTSINKDVDCWYPDSEFRKTLCGKLSEDSFLCPQDQLHTELTTDLDYNFDIQPSIKFKNMLQNRWIGDNEQFTHLEAEVRPSLLGKTTKNPLLLLKANQEMCVFGPWMGDILDYVVNTRYNNEIHPINQMWYKSKENELTLTSIVDATGYFDKTGNNEIQASGLNQAMRYHIAFKIPNVVLNADASKKLEYQINGVGIDFANSPQLDIQEEGIFLKHKGIERLKILDNSFVRIAKTHRTFLDKVRTRSDGSIQGYIVVETVPITNRGGSINIVINNN
jgi:hypothetical protein